MLSAGDQFPEFALQDGEGTLVTLKSLLGSSFVMYFYPKDDTSGCTVEACQFNETLPNFGDIKVIGVSPDPVKSHQKFATKFDLQFTLLSDPDKSLCQSVGVWVEKSMYGKKYMGVERTSFLVGQNGVVIHVWNKVKPDGHAAEVLTRAKQ